MTKRTQDMPPGHICRTCREPMAREKVIYCSKRCAQKEQRRLKAERQERARANEQRRLERLAELAKRPKPKGPPVFPQFPRKRKEARWRTWQIDEIGLANWLRATGFGIHGGLVLDWMRRPKDGRIGAFQPERGNSLWRGDWHLGTF